MHIASSKLQENILFKELGILKNSDKIPYCQAIFMRSYRNGKLPIKKILERCPTKIKERLRGQDQVKQSVTTSLVVTVAISLVVTAATSSEPGETDYGYKYTTHDRPVGQSMLNCSASNISDMATILCCRGLIHSQKHQKTFSNIFLLM